MNAVNILVDVHCIQPAWATYSKHIEYVSKYRVYIDNDLLTERTWAWSNETYIQENIWIYAIEKSSHIVTIDPILILPEQAVFKLSNFTVVNTPFTSEQINDLTISFTL